MEIFLDLQSKTIAECLQGNMHANGEHLKFFQKSYLQMFYEKGKVCMRTDKMRPTLINTAL